MFAKSTAILLAAAISAGGALCTGMLVSTDWLAKHSTDAGVVILHVAATRAGYDSGHIPGARFVALGELAVTRDGIPNELPPVGDLKMLMEGVGVSDDSQVILYSEASVLPATRAYFTLDYLGHGDRTALLDGGLEEWRSEGRPLAKESTAVPAGRFTPHPKPDRVVSFDAVERIPTNASEILLDVRSPADFHGEQGSHIPGARNAFWMENQISRDNQALKAAEELRKMYEGLGVTPDSHVVTYCNTGMQASESYFVLKYLGYDVRLYDGSMSEWKAKGAPVEK